MRVLVTGSHGFIGSQLVKALKARGDEVFESDVKVDRSLFMLKEFPLGYLDEIYHLACVNQEYAVIRQELNLSVNAYGTKFMAEFAAERGARFVYTSTASVYGCTPQQPIGSKRVPAPKSDYAIAKLAGEHFVKNSGADYTIFRLSNVYGPGQTTENPYCGVVAKFLEAARAGKPLQIIGDGSQTRDFTYVEDILPHLMNPELKGVLNCSHGEETPIWWLASNCAGIADPDGIKTVFEHAPERPVDGIQRRVLLSDVKCPTGLPEGLQRTLRWMDAQETAEADGSPLRVGSGKETRL